MLFTNITIPSYPTNPNVPWYDPNPFSYDKIGDQPGWWKYQPTCVVNPNTQQYTTPVNMTINNTKKGNN